MNAASVKEIKTGLEQPTQKELVEACLRLVKFKKENKELLTYLLFEEADEAGYISNVKESLALGRAMDAAPLPALPIPCRRDVIIAFGLGPHRL